MVPKRGERGIKYIRRTITALTASPASCVLVPTASCFASPQTILRYNIREPGATPTPTATASSSLPVPVPGNVDRFLAFIRCASRSLPRFRPFTRPGRLGRSCCPTRLSPSRAQTTRTEATFSRDGGFALYSCSSLLLQLPTLKHNNNLLTSQPFLNFDSLAVPRAALIVLTCTSKYHRCLLF